MDKDPREEARLARMHFFDDPPEHPWYRIRYITHDRKVIQWQTATDPGLRMMMFWLGTYLLDDESDRAVDGEATHRFHSLPDDEKAALATAWAIFQRERGVLRAAADAGNYSSYKNFVTAWTLERLNWIEEHQIETRWWLALQYPEVFGDASPIGATAPPTEPLRPDQAPHAMNNLQGSLTSRAGSQHDETGAINPSPSRARSCVHFAATPAAHQDTPESPSVQLSLSNSINLPVKKHKRSKTGPDDGYWLRKDETERKKWQDEHRQVVPNIVGRRWTGNNPDQDRKRSGAASISGYRHRRTDSGYAGNSGNQFEDGKPMWPPGEDKSVLDPLVLQPLHQLPHKKFYQKARAGDIWRLIARETFEEWFEGLSSGELDAKAHEFGITFQALGHYFIILERQQTTEENPCSFTIATLTSADKDERDQGHPMCEIVDCLEFRNFTEHLPCLHDKKDRLHCQAGPWLSKDDEHYTRVYDELFTDGKRRLMEYQIDIRMVMPRNGAEFRLTQVSLEHLRRQPSHRLVLQTARNSQTLSYAPEESEGASNNARKEKQIR